MMSYSQSARLRKIASCCNCCQKFNLSGITYPLNGRIPRLLMCGHTICDKCLYKQVGSTHPIKCNDCSTVSPITKEVLEAARQNLDRLDEHFPINDLIFGQLVINVLLSIKPAEMRYQQSQSKVHMVDFPRQRQPRMNDLYKHDNFQNNQDIDKFLCKLTQCKIHDGFYMNVFCQVCQTLKCSNCITKFCSGHKFILTEDMEDDCVKKMEEKKKVVGDIQRRVIDTIEKLEKKRFAMLTGTINQKSVESTIISSFSQIYGKLMCAEQKALKEAQDNEMSFDTIMSQLKESTVYMANLVAASQYVVATKKKKGLHKSVLSALEAAAETPWYLDDTMSSLSPNIEVELDNYIQEHIMDFCKLKVNAAGLKLLPSSNLPPNVEMPPLPDDKSDAASQKSDKSGSALSGTGSVFDFGNANFDFRPKHKSRCSSSNSVAGPFVNMVKPLPVSQPEDNMDPSTELVVSAEVKVIVTYIESPECIYIQLQSQLSRLRNLTETIGQTKDSWVSPNPEDITPDGLYVIEDSTLKFARVKYLEDLGSNEEESSKCRVRLIDYGHVMVVQKKRLRILPDNHSAAFAVLCKLGGCVPVGGEWSKEATHLLRKIISGSNGACSMPINGKLGPIFIVDLRTMPFNKNELPTSARDSLVFMGQACLSSGVENKIRKNIKNDLGKTGQAYFVRQKLSDIENVVVLDVISPAKFYIRKEYLIKFYNDLQKQMNDHYRSWKDSGWVYTPVEGMCVVCNTRDHWARGRITQVINKNDIRIFLVDEGVECSVTSDKLRTLALKFRKAEELVSECKLACVKPVSGETWNEEAIKLMKDYVNKRVCRVNLHHPHIKQRKSYDPVFLYKTNINDDDVSLNSLLVRKGLAIGQGTLLDMMKKEVETPVVPRTIMKCKPSTSAAPSEKTTPKDTKSEGVLVKLEVGIISAASPSDIYVRVKTEASKDEFIDLHLEIQKTYIGSQADDDAQWKIGDKCAASSRKTQKWSRGTIEEVKEDKKQVKVLLYDFDQTEDMSISSIRSLDSKFTEVQHKPLKCHLSGIAPASGTRWPMLTCETLQELIAQYNQFYISKDGELEDNKSLPVQLWVYHITPGGALTATIREYRNINSKIIEKGLAIPSRIIKKDSSPSESKVSVVQPEEKKSEMAIIVKSNQSHVGSCANRSWLPPKPLPNTEFLAIGTYVEENLDIYLQVAEEANKNLSLFETWLTPNSVNRRPKDSEMFCFKGDICVSKYELDGKYYRAEVIDVINHSEAFVKFVDYGNTQKCPISSLRKDAVLNDFPVLAHRCKLAGIIPVSGNKWSQDIGDKVHKSVVDQYLSCTVTGDLDENGAIPVKLILSDNSTNLANLLIKTGNAVRVEPEVKPEPLESIEETEPDIVVVEEISVNPFQDVISKKGTESLKEDSEIKDEGKKESVNSETGADIKLFPPMRKNLDWAKLNENE